MKPSIQNFFFKVTIQLGLCSLATISFAKSLPEACKQTALFYQQKNLGASRAPNSDYLLVDKSRRLLHLFKAGEIIKSFRVGLGSSPKGHKQKAGDGKTPEGSYTIDSRNSGSSYHLSLHISYPNQEDIDNARRLGVDPGGAIMIHGLPNESWKKAFLRHPSDWTKGCVAVNDAEIEDIWDMVPLGTPIDLCP